MGQPPDTRSGQRADYRTLIVFLTVFLGLLPTVGFALARSIVPEDCNWRFFGNERGALLWSCVVLCPSILAMPVVWVILKIIRGRNNV